MFVLFSLGSIILGVVAMLLPIIGIVRKKKTVWLTLSSLSVCTVSIIIQLLHLAADAFYKDSSSIYDTINVRCVVSLQLFVIVVILNVIYQSVNGKRRG